MGVAGGVGGVFCGLHRRHCCASPPKASYPKGPNISAKCVSKVSEKAFASRDPKDHINIRIPMWYIVWYTTV